MRKKLYQWQEDCLERWFANNGRGMVQAVTGSGKTLLALTAAGRLEEQLGRRLHVKIVVPTGALMRQWNRDLREFLADSGAVGAEPDGTGTDAGDLRAKIGLRGGGCKDSPDCRYMIYVINSARYELARQILTELKRGEAVFLIADECHRYESGQNRLIFEFLPYIKACETNFFSLGLSATLPSGQARRYLASVLGRKIYTYEIAKALAHRTVSQYDIYHIKLSFRKRERMEYDEITDRMTFFYHKLLKIQPFLRNLEQTERYEALRQLSGGKDKSAAEAASMYLKLSYKRKNLVCLAGARVDCACELLKRLDQGEKVIIFGERIRQAQELYKLLEELYPGRTGQYHSEMGQQANRNALERFRLGEVRILIACKAVDEGVDIPDVSVGIILSGTSTQRQRIQRLGRIIRRKEEKDRAKLYYLHMADTTEDACFLPDRGESRIFELEYLTDKQKFSNPLYDNAAAKVLDKMRMEDASEDKIREAVRCLELGCVRSDWMLERDEIEERIREAKYISDRNYWVCMKKMRNDG